MRTFSRLPIMLGGALITAFACGRAPRASIPNIDLHIDEPVSVPVRITARETVPSDTG
jgi:hypothetical protein